MKRQLRPVLDVLSEAFQQPPHAAAYVAASQKAYLNDASHPAHPFAARARESRLALSLIALVQNPQTL
jgi:hypothetical protein